MIIPETLIKIIFKFFPSSKIKNTFLSIYGDYLQRKKLLKVYEFSDIDLLINDFPKKIKKSIDGYVLYDVMVLDDGIVRLDKYHYFISDRFTLYIVVKKLSRFRKAVRKKILNSSFLMSGMYSNSFNLFHLITDSIAPNYSPTLKNYHSPILVPKIHNSFQSDLLKKLHIKNFDATNEPVFVKELDLNLRSSKWRESNYKTIRDVLGVNIQNKKADRRMVYATRSGNARNYKNEKSLINFLTTYGVDIIDFSKVSLNERMQILGETAVLIGQYGAGLTNLIFMPDNSYIIDLQTVNVHRNDYCMLANACNINYVNVPFMDRYFNNIKSYSLSKDDFYHIKVAIEFLIAKL